MGAIDLPQAFMAGSILAGTDARKSNRFLAALCQQDYLRLAACLRPVALAQGRVLHDNGDPIEFVYFPYSGAVSLVATMRDGTGIETITLGRAGIVGCAAAWGGRHCIGRAVVQLPGSASRLPAAEFRAAARDSDAIYQLALRHNELLVAQIQQAVACNALHGLEARLCRWLLHAHDCTDGNAIPVTQELLSQMLGVRRTSVTVAARALKMAGMIGYRRGRMEILDRGKLKAATCECYEWTRHLIDQTFPMLPEEEQHLAAASETRLRNPPPWGIHDRDRPASTTS
jgi:CRP-like cAMP-binding protein